jgi:hypothetical protein
MLGQPCELYLKGGLPAELISSAIANGAGASGAVERTVKDAARPTAGRTVVLVAVEGGEGGQGRRRDLEAHCPRRKPPFSAVKRPARPYKSPIQNRFT